MCFLAKFEGGFVKDYSLHGLGIFQIKATYFIWVRPRYLGQGCHLESYNKLGWIMNMASYFFRHFFNDKLTHTFQRYRASNWTNPLIRCDPVQPMTESTDKEVDPYRLDPPIPAPRCFIEKHLNKRIFSINYKNCHQHTFF